MRHTLTFRLMNPTEKKWFLYKSLVPHVDEICVEHGLIVEGRCSNEDTHEFTVTIVEPPTGNLHNATIKVAALLAKNGIENKLVYSNSIERPRIHTAVAKWTLAAGYESKDNWDKWVAVMPEIDAYAGEYEIKSKRNLDPENYVCELTNTFTDMESFTKYVFYSSQLCSGRGIMLEPVEEHKMSEVIAEDIFSELKSTTRQHKQLSLL